jgi:ribosomal protein L14E/L6E/L27E
MHESILHKTEIIIIIIINRNTARVECQSRTGTDNKTANWNHLKITQTVPEQHTGKGKAENSHIGTANKLREVLM